MIYLLKWNLYILKSCSKWKIVTVLSKKIKYNYNIHVLLKTKLSSILCDSVLAVLLHYNQDKGLKIDKIPNE